MQQMTRMTTHQKHQTTCAAVEVAAVTANKQFPAARLVGIETNPGPTSPTVVRQQQSTITPCVFKYASIPAAVSHSSTPLLVMLWVMSFHQLLLLFPHSDFLVTAMDVHQQFDPQSSHTHHSFSGSHQAEMDHHSRTASAADRQAESHQHAAAADAVHDHGSRVSVDTSSNGKIDSDYPASSSAATSAATSAAAARHAAHTIDVHRLLEYNLGDMHSVSTASLLHLLNLPHDADVALIQSTKRNLSRQYHPDRHHQQHNSHSRNSGNAQSHISISSSIDHQSAVVSDEVMKRINKISEELEDRLQPMEEEHVSKLHSMFADMQGLFDPEHDHNPKNPNHMLRRAVLSNDLPAITHAFTQGADRDYYVVIGIINQLTFAPLYHAVKTNNLELAQHLVEHGASAAVHHSAALNLACESKHGKDFIPLLWQANANLNFAEDSEWWKHCMEYLYPLAYWTPYQREIEQDLKQQYPSMDPQRVPDEEFLAKHHVLLQYFGDGIRGRKRASEVPHIPLPGPHFDEYHRDPEMLTAIGALFKSCVMGSRDGIVHASRMSPPPPSNWHIPYVHQTVTDFNKLSHFYPVAHAVSIGDLTMLNILTSESQHGGLKMKADQGYSAALSQACRRVATDFVAPLAHAKAQLNRQFPSWHGCDYFMSSRANKNRFRHIVSNPKLNAFRLELIKFYGSKKQYPDANHARSRKNEFLVTSQHHIKQTIKQMRPSKWMSSDKKKSSTSQTITHPEHTKSQSTPV